MYIRTSSFVSLETTLYIACIQQGFVDPKCNKLQEELRRVLAKKKEEERVARAVKAAKAAKKSGVKAPKGGMKAPKGGVRKPHRFWPGTVALKEI